VTDRSELAADVKAGLLATPKRLSCRWFYDATGARIFEEICDLPEYYLTRAEQEILTRNAGEIAAALPPGGTLLELGSGNSEKTRTLIEEILRRDGSLDYVAIDISEPTLTQAAEGLRRRYPTLVFTGIVAEYHEGLARLADLPRRGARLVLWLGSNVGNLDRSAAAVFLTRVRSTLRDGDRLLIGIDLRKDPAVLVRAYDDTAGVTARFNLNLLRRINAELGGGFDLDAFRHRATWDERDGRIQMHLMSVRRQRVPIAGLGIEVAFEAGEAVHTEDSYKYSREEIAALAAASGFRVARQWLDGEARFASTLFAP
jgi:L-histidine Nalpha-methyltransferase